MPQRAFNALRALIWLPTVASIFVVFYNPRFSYASEEINGIVATFYNNNGYNQSPPLPEDSGAALVGTLTYQYINQNFDAEPPLGLYEDFIVKYEGYITSPVSTQINFWPHADDGTLFYLDGQLIDEGNWVDKGGGGYQTSPQEFVAGVSKPFTYWYYENGGGANTSLYWDVGNGWEIVPASAFTKQSITTTTIAPYLNSPQNLKVDFFNQTSVNLSWASPEASNSEIERYAIFFSEDNFQSGWAISSTETFATIENLKPNTSYKFKVRADNDSIGAYSGWSNEISVLTLSPTTTSTSTTSTTSSTTTTTLLIPPRTTEPVQTTLPQKEEAKVEDNQKENKIEQEKAEVSVTTQPPAQISTSTTSSTVSTVFSTGTSSTTTTIPIKIEEEDNKNETIANNLNPRQIVEILSNPESLATLSKEESKKVFELIDPSKMTEEEVSLVVAAVQNANVEIRKTFESTVDLFDGAFDEYKMVNSEISVGERRTVIAVNLITASVAVSALASGASNTPGGAQGGGGAGNSGSGSGSSNNSGRKQEEEEGSEMAGEIAGDGYDWVSKISIYKIKGEERVLDWKAFTKKFILGILNLSFTIAGSVVVYFTLSGSIQKIALVSTLAALASSMYLHMREPKE